MNDVRECLRNANAPLTCDEICAKVPNITKSQLDALCNDNSAIQSIAVTPRAVDTSLRNDDETATVCNATVIFWKTSSLATSGDKIVEQVVERQRSSTQQQANATQNNKRAFTARTAPDSTPSKKPRLGGPVIGTSSLHKSFKSPVKAGSMSKAIVTSTPVKSKSLSDKRTPRREISSNVTTITPAASNNISVNVNDDTAALSTMELAARCARQSQRIDELNAAIAADDAHVSQTTRSDDTLTQLITRWQRACRDALDELLPHAAARRQAEHFNSEFNNNNNSSFFNDQNGNNNGRLHANNSSMTENADNDDDNDNDNDDSGKRNKTGNDDDDERNATVLTRTMLMRQLGIDAKTIGLTDDDDDD